MKTHSQRVIAAVLALGALLGSAAHAKTVYEDKLVHWNGPDMRMECAKWASGDWPWPMKGGWKTCIGHKYVFLNHAFFLTVDAPDGTEVNDAVRHAAQVAAAAAAAAFAGTPGEFVSRAGAALAAAKVAFAASLSADMAARFDLRIDHRTWW